MNASERLDARLQGKPVDKIPNMNIAMGLVAKVAGATYSAYVQDFRILVEGNLICAERFGFDTVSVISDPMREAAAFGAKLIFPKDGVPYSDPPLLSGGLNLERVRVTDPLDNPRTLDRIKGIELLRQSVLADYPVIGWVEGVLAETADLRGAEALMYDLMDEEEGLFELMDIILAQQCRFALEQIKAGADVIGVGNAVASQIGPNLYARYALSYDKALVRYIQDHGAKVKLHICGNITALLPLLVTVAPDILDIDWMVDFKAAAQTFAGTKTSVCGNVDPVSVLLQGSPALVEQEVCRCTSLDDPTVLVAAGCEVPAQTPVENLLIMDRLLYR
ncbi:MAG: uroporphyrinogen decarboxylase family protein [Coriobacteriia bacterium]|nr:uroporphyrinogen decarboxylase family protein [Coriobacteriia bacterium]